MRRLLLSVLAVFALLAQPAFSSSYTSTTANGSVTYAKIQNVAATKIIGNPTGSPAAPSEISLAGGLDFSGTTLRGAVVHPGYIAGNWYSPALGIVAVGGALPANSIRLLPFTISKPVTVQALAARVTTLSAAGNFQLALYANNATTGRPTGAALASTASLSTGTATAVSGSVTQVTLQPGTYWMAINQDNAVAAYTSISSTSPQMATLIGSATLANITSTTTNVPLCITVSQTFGTWPDLSAGSFTETVSNVNALVFFQAA